MNSNQEDKELIENKKNIYFSVQNTVKKAKIQKYFREREEISGQGLTFGVF